MGGERGEGEGGMGTLLGRLAKEKADLVRNAARAMEFARIG